MKRRIAVIATAAMLWSMAIGVVPTQAADAAYSLPVYYDKSKTVEQRVDDLLGRMTLDEKIGQMVQAERASITPEEVQTYNIGSVFSGGGSFPNGKQSDSTRDKWASMFDSYQDGALSTRLGIPILYGVDAVHGHNNVIGSTMFPHNIGLGATRNADLVEKMGAATAEEVKAAGTNWAFAPTIADPQNIKWGRTYEGYGDNPTLVAEMGAAFIKGLQGETSADLSKSNKAVATAKHFIGEGYTDNGANQGNVSTLNEQQVTDSALAMYQAAIDAGVRTVMASYNSIQGIKMHANKRLLTDTLKGTGPGQLGFTGFVVSDYNAVQQITKDWDGNPVSGLKDQIRVAVNAGVDMMMMPSEWKNTITQLKALAESGDVTEARIDDAVSRILRVKFESGLFEHPKTDKSLAGTFGSDAHKAVARQAVSESLVLLKNDEVNGTPLLSQLAGMDDIYVAGKSADNIGVQLGGWSVTWQGAAGNTTPGTTILQGIKQVQGKQVTYNEHGRGAAGHDVAIVVVGEQPYAESNGDNLNGLKLSNEDLATLDNVKASGTPTIVILLSGRPLIISDRLNDWDALIEAWLPGTEGAGVADVLFGSSDFKGKLPIRWPFHLESYQAIQSGKSNLDDAQILFDYGYGLTKNEETPALKPVPEKPDAAGAVTIPAKIEAENYAAMKGLDTENTSDAGGGRNVGWSDAGDTLDYNIKVPQAGTYDISIRYAVGSGSSTGLKLLDGNNKTVGVLSVGDTGGYQNWRTAVIQGVFRTAGVQTLRVQLTGGGINLNWYDFGTRTGDVPPEPVVVPPTGNGETLPVVQAGAVESWISNERDPANINWYYAPRWQDGDKKLEQQPNIDVTTVGTGALQTTINVDPSKEYQSMIGMGTSMEESTVHNLVKMSDAKQEEVLRSMIDPVNGAGLSLIRTTIGTADFTAQQFYTYDDMPAGQTDPTLAHFSIQKDIDFGIIKTLKTIQRINPDVQFFASPWSPPGWMKTTDSMIKGQVKPEYMSVLADYYVKYIQAYKEQGIAISAMTLQNEPLLEIEYPSTKMPWEQEAELAKLLKQKLTAAGLDVKIWIFDHNPGDTMTYPAMILADPANRDAIDGTAFHDYGGDLGQMTALHDMYPEENVYLTERAVWGTVGADRIAQYYRNWARSYNSWVVMLDSDIRTHKWVGTPDPTMIIQDSASRDNYWLTPEFYLLGQFSKFVKPGYTRIDSNYGSSDKVTNVAFLSPDKKTIVTVVINQTAESQLVRLVSEGTQVSAVVPAKSVVTYRWNRPVIASAPGTVQAVDFAKAAGTYAAGNGYLSGINGSDNAATATFEYNIRVNEQGSYYADLEYAGVPAAGAAYELLVDGQPAGGSALTQATAQGTFAKARQTVYLTAGVHKLTLKVTGTQVDVKSIAFSHASAYAAVPGLIQTEKFTAASGILLTAADSQGSQAVGYADNGDWIDYTLNAPAAGDYDVTYRFASGSAAPTVTWATYSPAVLSGSTGLTDWKLGTGGIHLDAGTQTVRLNVSEGTALDWFVIGSTLIPVTQTVAEDGLGGAAVAVELLGGTFAPNLTAAAWQASGINGVTVSGVQRIDDTHAVVTLEASGAADIDTDRGLYLTAQASETTAAAAVSSTAVTVSATNDAETLTAAVGTLPYGVDNQTVRIVLSGGTFNSGALSQITLGGDAAASGVTIKSAAYVSAHEADIVLGWNGTAYYGDRTIQVNVPAGAYSDSTGGTALKASFKLEGTVNNAQAVAIPGTVDLTKYYQVSGVQTGSKLTGFDKGDWADFMVNVPAEGKYVVTFNVKYPNGGSKGIQLLNAQGQELAAVTVPNMSGSTAVVGVRATVQLQAGEQKLRIYSGVGTFDVEQLTFEALASAAADAQGMIKVEGESYTTADSLVIQYGSINNLGYVGAGGNIYFSVNVPEAGNYKLTYQYATAQGGVSAAFHADGQLLATTSLPSTGGWGNYTAVNGIVSLEAGVHTIKVLDQGDGFNLDWFSLQKTDEAVISGRAAAPAITGSSNASGTSVKFVSSTPGAKIYYTIDGTLPTQSSMLYTEQLHFPNTVVIRAVAIADGMRDSFVSFQLTNEKLEPGAPVTPADPEPGPGTNPGPGTGVTTPTEGGKPHQSGGKVVLEAPAPVVDQKTGRAVTEIAADSLDEAAAQAASGSKVVSVEVPQAEGSSNYEIVLPAKYVTEGKGPLELVTANGTITIPGSMLNKVELNGAATISIVITAADGSDLGEAFANKPVIELSVYINGKRAEWNNVLAPVTAAIPYKPTAEEKANADHITVRYIDGQGRIIAVPSGRYDEESGSVVFTTTHFGRFAAAYVNKTFNDIAKYGWAKKSIEAMASKGVIEGTSAASFSPEKQVKRADFVLLLARALGLSAAPQGNSFDDVNASAYYADAIATAQALGIVQGKGGNVFEPNATITRQEMMTLAARALNAAGIKLEAGSSNDLASFKDKNAVAKYAADSIATLVKHGIVTGSGSNINPNGTATRAETAVIIDRLYHLQ